MRIVVTGGAGFIGSHIVEHALKGGHEVLVLDDLSSGKRENLPAGCNLEVLDIRHADAVNKAFDNFMPEAVSHQAAQASVTVSMRDPALDASVNVIGGANVLKASLEYGVKRYVFASTGGAIYGNVPEGQAADESWVPKPYSPYAIHKQAHEQLLSTLGSEGNMDCTILRYANVYGPRQDPFGEAGVIAIFFERALSGRSLQINALKETGDDGCTRDYTFVADVARANLAALEGRLPYDIMNVGTGIATCTRDLATATIQLSSEESEVLNGEARRGDVGHSTLDPSRFKESIGTPVDLAVGLEETARWYSSL